MTGRWCRAVLMLPAIALVFGGCAAKTPSLSETARVGLGRIGVVALDEPLKPTLAGPTPLGGVGGGVTGAAKGLTISVLSAAGCLVTLGYVPELCVSALMTPYWIGRGTVEGALKAVPERERRAGRAAVLAAIDEVDAQWTALAVEEEGRRRAPIPFGPVDSLADVRLVRLGLEERADLSSGTLELSVPNVDPPLAVRAEARLRVVRLSDGDIRFQRSYTYRGGRQAPLREWALDEAALFRSERDAALDRLVRDIADELYGPEPPSAPSEEAPAQTAPTPDDR